MAINEHIEFTVQLAGRPYTLKVKRDEEGHIRNAVKVIDRKINQYRNHFSGAEQKELEELDYVNMTSIQAMSENVVLELKNKMFEDKIKALTHELDEYLKS
ncbi:cell division protein ZapA [Viscerimonas tarda]